MDGSLTAIEISKKLGMPRQTVTSIRTKVLERAANKEYQKADSESNLVYLKNSMADIDDKGVPSVYIEGPVKKIASRG